MKKRYWLLLLSFVASVWGYEFGQSDHLEHLPILYRLIEGERYLPNDDFVNSNLSGYNPRLLFFYLLLPFCHLLGVKLTFFLGNFLCNLALAGVSALFARRFWGEQAGKWVDIWSAAAVLLGSVVGWGETAHLRSTFFIPSSAATACVLWALYFALVPARAWAVALILGFGTLIHPLICPLSGAIIWTILILQHFLRRKGSFGQFLRENIRLWLWFGLWVAITAAIVLPYLLQNWWAQRIEGREFVEIYAHFRNPHHFLPSFFMSESDISLTRWWLLSVGAMFFLLRQPVADLKAMGDKYYEGEDEEISFLSLPRRAHWGALFLLLSILLLLLPFGYWGVELWKSRFWATLQIFRFLFFAKWLILMLTGAYIGRVLYEYRDYPISKTLMAIAFFALLNAPYYLLVAILLGLLLRFYSFVAKPFAMVRFATIICGIFALWDYVEKGTDTHAMGYLSVIVAAFLVFPQHKLRAQIAVGITVLWLGHFLWVERLQNQAFALQMSAHQWQEERADSPLRGVSKFLRDFSSPHIIILAPPGSSELRLTARRALVVDFKTLPFDDLALVRWRDRLHDCYGKPDKLGFEAQRWNFVPNYQYAPVEHFRRLAQKYGATYILLYAKTPHDNLSLVYQDSLYKLAKVQ